jgi:N utilization substance protein A
VRVAGALESFNLSTEDAEALILRARVAAGWIEATDLEPPAEPAVEPVAFEEEPAEA